MLDFVKIRTATKSKGRGGEDQTISIYPEFVVGPSNDLMIRGRAFYAVWDEESGFWSTNPYVVQKSVDDAIFSKMESYPPGVSVDLKLMRDFSSGKWDEFGKYVKSLPDHYHQLDNALMFSDQDVTKECYATKQLPYPLKAGDVAAYDELVSVLYDPIERQKIEWAIGSIVSGDSKKNDKIFVLYGAPGTGKSTILNIIQMLFEGYYTVFDAKTLGQSSAAFALDQFRDNPLVAIQHDGDLSRIEDNTKLNSLSSHELLSVNEKFKAAYKMQFDTCLFMGTNKPVKITDAKSGIVRRLVDIHPTGDKIPVERYRLLMAQIRFELGAIADHCLSVYSGLGRNYYDDYVPVEMIGATNIFFNFIADHLLLFKKEDGTTLKQAWELYKRWADEGSVHYPMSRGAVKEELKNYFTDYKERARGADGEYLRCVYRGFDFSKFDYMMDSPEPQRAITALKLDLSSRDSIFDKIAAEYPAQYSSVDGAPLFRWANVNTTLAAIDTSKLHYVKLPENHIVIDFDLKTPDGEKSLDLNLEAAAKWPSTYAELSKSGKGVHLHYIYDGDVSKLSPKYEDGIEVKVFSGNSSLRRKLTRCNDIPIATLNSGLPEKKGGRKVLNFDGVKSEKQLRNLIERNLRKEICPGTKPSVMFIDKLLRDAYSSGLKYDLSDMEDAVIAFASNSTHHPAYCIKLAAAMPYRSDEAMDGVDWDTDTITFFDIEVFPNLFLVVYKEIGDGKRETVLVNPTPNEIESLCRRKLVGFNNRRYDNHILYGRLQGYTNQELYLLSSRIIDNVPNSTFSNAYSMSYADIYDFASKKQSLKKWEIELGVSHKELGLPWGEDVPEDIWKEVTDYCINDVRATEAVWNACHSDFLAREMLAELSGLTVNDTTQRHASKIIFGGDKNPQSSFVYTHLDEMFPGYKYEFGKSTYRGEVVGEGGYVYSEPGIYENVALLDIASMHPNSLIQLNLFGDEYTNNFKGLLDARLAIKHKDWEAASSVLNGRLKPYLGNPEDAEKLAYALKIVINSVYGLTAARFECDFKDPRNIDNIVAKRGALFMVDLKHAVMEKGYTVAHIKTDSIKIPNADAEIIEFVTEFGNKYGYSFEHEATYSRLCLINDAVYVCKDSKDGHWSATGLQFAVPYVFKSLFTHEPFVFSDFCETKSVSGNSSLYLDLNEGDDTEHNYVFVGRTGSFCPVVKGAGGGRLMREKDGKYYAASGTTGYLWLESEFVKEHGLEDKIDQSYYEKLALNAIKAIERFGSYEQFVKE